MFKKNLYLSQAISRDHNNYNLIRLIASLAVIYGHSFFLFKSGGNTDFITSVYNAESSGGLAVELFFYMSGIYISLSFVNSKTYLRFSINRIFRIWPALIVCIILTVFILGYFVTGSFDYLRQDATWKYLISNSIILKGATSEIPGFFTENFYPKIVNGSLWTLKIELRCYFILFLLGIMGAFKSRPYLFILAILCTIVIIITHSNIGTILMTDQRAVKLIIFFLAGSLSYYYQNYILIDWKIAVSLMILTILWPPLIYLAMIYGSLTLGASKFARKIYLPGDYSYGIYIYAFLVQQTTAHFFPDINSLESCLLVVPVTVILSIFSWHFFELPAMNFAKKLS
jgi:peptidoglycan/LPS O-acetylase OafA/YrhL